MNKLEIVNLKASVAGKQILKGVNLTINGGEIHAIMGPNGTGKSTLASVIMGHADYVIEDGQILLNGQNLLEFAVDERARAGMFLAMQYPSEISGVTNSQFLRAAINARREADDPIKFTEFNKLIKTATAELKMPADMSKRYLNEGFSGGEKKKNEILQLMALKPKFAVLDEIDSGLDIDAIRIVGGAVENVVAERKDMGVLMITHYQRLLQYIRPQFVHVFYDGQIIRRGGLELAEKLEQEGYAWVDEERNG